MATQIIIPTIKIMEQMVNRIKIVNHDKAYACIKLHCVSFLFYSNMFEIAIKSI